MTNLIKSGDERGLTLVEALVSLVVLSLGLIPSLAILTSSTRISALIKNNLIAANLAQEGIEVVRAVRDSNWFAAGNPPFYRYLVDCGGPTTCNWRVAWDTNGPLLALGTNPPLKFDSATGTYNYSTGIDTGFKRVITVTKVVSPCDCELKVISRVEWIRYGVVRTQEVESHLFDWK